MTPSSPDLLRDIRAWLRPWTAAQLSRTSPAIREAVALLQRVEAAALLDREAQTPNPPDR